MALTPRPARRAPFNPPESAFVSAAVFTLATLMVAVFYPRWLYFQAGVRYVDLLGSVAGVLLVAAGMVAAGYLYRSGRSRRTVTVVAAATAVAAVGLAVLPPVAAGAGWLTVVLTVLALLVCDLVFACWVLGAVLYAPLPWLAEPEGFEPSSVLPDLP